MGAAVRATPAAALGRIPGLMTEAPLGGQLLDGPGVVGDAISREGRQALTGHRCTVGAGSQSLFGGAITERAVETILGAVVGAAAVTGVAARHRPGGRHEALIAVMMGPPQRAGAAVEAADGNGAAGRVWPNRVLRVSAQPDGTPSSMASGRASSRLVTASANSSSSIEGGIRNKASPGCVLSVSME